MREEISGEDALESGVGVGANALNPAVKSATNALAKKLPLIGLPLALRSVGNEIKEHLEKGDHKMAAAAAFIGTPEVLASTFGFLALGAGDASRELLRKALIKIGGEEFAELYNSDIYYLGQYIQQELVPPGNLPPHYAANRKEPSKDAGALQEETGLRNTFMRHAKHELQDDGLILKASAKQTSTQHSGALSTFLENIKSVCGDQTPNTPSSLLTAHKQFTPIAM